MKVGDFVEVDYVGRVKDSDEIFDLTREDVAKKENIFNKEFPYKPIVLIVGSDFIIKGLDEALQGMTVGEKKKFEIPKDKGFGERKEEMIKVIPLARFKEQDMKPYPGAVVNIGSFRGRVVSVDGGRVKVDFNHPLAGKVLEYDLEIKSEIKEPAERVKAVVKYFTGVEEVDVEIGGKTAGITIKKDVDVARPVKKVVSDAVIKWCGVEMVKFIEVFGKGEGDKGKIEK